MELINAPLQAQSGHVRWKPVSLADLASFRTGPFGSALHKSDYVVGGIPLVNPTHIIDGRIEPEDTVTVTPSVASRLSEFQLRRGDIVIGRRGEMGRCAVVGEREEGWLCGTGSLIIRPAEGVSSDYLQLMLSSPAIISAIVNGSVGTTMVNLNQSTLRAIQIPAPDSAEQHAIAEALTGASNLVSTLGALIEKKRAVKESLMQRLLTGRQRLSGFDGEWQETTLGAMAEVVGGGTPSSSIPAYWDGGVPWCTPTDITGNEGVYLTLTARTISKAGLDASSASILPTGTTLLCTRATVGEARMAAFPVATNQGFQSLVPKSHTDGVFLFYATRMLQPKLIAGASGSTFLEIGKKGVRAIPLLAPERDEQRAIAAVLSDVDAEIASLEARRNKAAMIKRGMAQDLLTGRTRLV